ncbi:MAG: hypothetical protein ACRBM6_26160 [Geminicoccales bacterium]
MSGGLGYLGYIGAEQFEWIARHGCRQPLDPIHGQTPFSRFQLSIRPGDRTR